MKIILLVLASLLSSPLYSSQLGRITAFNEINNEFEIQTSDGSLIKIIFYRTDIFRIWIGSDGILTDPAGDEETPIVEYIGAPIKVNQSKENDYYIGYICIFSSIVYGLAFFLFAFFVINKIF